MIELVNHVWSRHWPTSKPIVESAGQVYLISAISMIMGGTFGVIFGLVDAGNGVTDFVALQVSRTNLASVVGGFSR